MSGSKGLILDVGASEGEFALALAQLNPDLTVIAFEPIPTLVASILIRPEAEGLSNFSCYQLAIDETARKATFHVTNHHDHGVSGLLNFDREGIEQDDYWCERTDLSFTYELTVEVERLDTILAKMPSEQIRFIKVDTQGVDVRVLRSLGKMLILVEAGIVVASTTRITRLYAEETNDLLSTLSFLRDQGFDVHALKPNDSASNEFNVMFHRRGLDWRALESDLKLRGVPLYDGKHHWHLPAGRLLQPEAELTVARATQISLEESGVQVELLQSESARLQAKAARSRDELSHLDIEIDRLNQKIGEIQQAGRNALSRSEAAHSEALRVVEAVRTRLAGDMAASRAQTEAASRETAQLRATQVEMRKNAELAHRNAIQTTKAYSEAYRMYAADRDDGVRVSGVYERLLANAAMLQAETEALRNLLAARSRSDNTIRESDMTVSNLQDEIIALDRMVDVAHQDAIDARAAERDAVAANQELTTRLAAIFQSTSWRLTGPLRHITRLVRR